MKVRNNRSGRFISSKLKSVHEKKLSLMSKSKASKISTPSRVTRSQVRKHVETHQIPSHTVDAPSVSKDISWDVGRRIVELKVLAEALGSCDNEVEKCTARLDLRNCVQETRMGFASILWVTCGECGELNRVPTGKSHIPQGKKKEVIAFKMFFLEN